MALALATVFGFGRLTVFFFATGLGAAFLMDFFAGAFFLADACRLTARFAVLRAAERPAAGRFPTDFADVARLAALRLAITPALSEP